MKATPDDFIDIRGVNKTFYTKDGQVEAIEDLTLQIGKGEFIPIVGPSGCGKSTLLMMTAGLLPVTRGFIFIDRAEVRKPYTNLGIVFQRDLLLSWRTVMENVLLPVEIKGEEGKDSEHFKGRAHDLLESVGLSGFEKKYPDQLSGGMRQRVALCRALIKDPPLLLMDEPFGALDALTRDQMAVDLQELWLRNKKTVLFITHSIPEAVFLGDRVVVMSARPGRIVSEISIDIPRPRRLALYDTEEFSRYTKKIRELFEKYGVLIDKEATRDRTGSSVVNEQ